MTSILLILCIYAHKNLVDPNEKRHLHNHALNICHGQWNVASSQRCYCNGWMFCHTVKAVDLWASEWENSLGVLKEVLSIAWHKVKASIIYENHYKLTDWSISQPQPLIGNVHVQYEYFYRAIQWNWLKVQKIIYKIRWHQRVLCHCHQQVSMAPTSFSELYSNSGYKNI